jgi:hypothetical protein
MKIENPFSFSKEFSNYSEVKINLEKILRDLIKI